MHVKRDRRNEFINEVMNLSFNVGRSGEGLSTRVGSMQHAIITKLATCQTKGKRKLREEENKSEDFATNRGKDGLFYETINFSVHMLIQSYSFEREVTLAKTSIHLASYLLANKQAPGCQCNCNWTPNHIYQAKTMQHRSKRAMKIYVNKS